MLTAMIYQYKEHRLKSETFRLEEALKHYDQALVDSYLRLDQSSLEVYKKYADILMDFEKNPNAKQKHERCVYDSAYDFLSYVECNLDGDLYVALSKNCQHFFSLIGFLGKYCDRFQSLNDIENEAEANVRSKPRLLSIFHTHLK